MLDAQLINNSTLVRTLQTTQPGAGSTRRRCLVTLKQAGGAWSTRRRCFKVSYEPRTTAFPPSRRVLLCLPPVKIRATHNSVSAVASGLICYISGWGLYAFNSYFKLFKLNQTQIVPSGSLWHNTVLWSPLFLYDACESSLGCSN